MAGALTIGLGVLLLVGGSALGVEIVAQAGAAAIPLGLWIVVKSR